MGREMTHSAFTITAPSGTEPAFRASQSGDPQGVSGTAVRATGHHHRDDPEPRWVGFGVSHPGCACRAWRVPSERTTTRCEHVVNNILERPGGIDERCAEALVVQRRGRIPAEDRISYCGVLPEVVVRS